MSILYIIRGRKIFYLFIDLCIVFSSYLAAYAMLFGSFPPHVAGPLSFSHAAPLALLYALSCYFFQIYRIMWAYSDISDIFRLVAASCTGYALMMLYLLLAGLDYSGAMVFTSFLISSAATISYRAILRYLSSRSAVKYGDISGRRGREPGSSKRVLVAGAGEAGRIILSEYTRRGLGKLIIGFVDDDRGKIGRMLNGKMIFDTMDGINRVIDEQKISEIVIAMPSVGSEKINRIVSIVRKAYRALPIKTLPSLVELYQNKPLSISVRDISMIDLIGRDEFTVDNEIIEKRFSGKTVLITGAGGSIGSELCRQLTKFRIKKLVAVGRGEFSMYNLIKALNEHLRFFKGGPEIVYSIADVKDRPLMERVFAKHRPEIVFHAAAHKHVPLMEFNEAEAFQNNVLGTKIILDLSRAHGVDEFVFISTDKAVNPVSVMGATKRIAEIITSYYHQVLGLKTTIVRFGNVIGSRGSVIPLFMEQIERGGPVTVTHPDVTRYFMSIPEATLLVITSASYSRGGEIFVLDMGKQYRVAEIAARLIEFYGYRTDEDVRIEYTGLRPGEKMHEDLFYDEENLVKTENEKIYILSHRDSVGREGIESFIEKTLPGIVACSADEIREIIKDLVAEYEPEEKQGGTPSNIKLIT